MQRLPGEDHSDLRPVGEEAVPVGIITLDGRLPSYPPPLAPRSHACFWHEADCMLLYKTIALRNKPGMAPQSMHNSFNKANKPYWLMYAVLGLV